MNKKHIQRLIICVSGLVMLIGTISKVAAFANGKGVTSAGVETVLSNFDETNMQEVNEFSSVYIGGAGVGLIFQSLDEMSQEDLLYLSEDTLLPGVVEVEQVVEIKPQETKWGYTNLGIANVSESLNIRKEPNTSSTIVGKLPKDAACEIMEVENGWIKMKSGKVEGYVSEEYLITGEAAVQRGTEVAKLTATVTALNLKVRKEPNTQSGVRALLGNGAAYEIVDQVDGWVKIMFEDEESFLSSDYVLVGDRLKTALTLTEEKYGVGVTDPGADLAEYASQFAGNPYVYGGTSLTNGADCSGFTLTIFKKYGIELSHSARAQSGKGTNVEIDSLRPGDLVFYSGSTGIDHVAIYIGGGQVVHASNPKNGIMISELNYRNPTCARRLL